MRRNPDSLPNSVPYGSVRGDLHVHTAWMTGKSASVRWQEAAQSLGYQYIAICDHAKSQQFSRGLTEEQRARRGKRD